MHFRAQVVENKKVTFKFKGKNYKVKTNYKGKAILKIAKKYKKGKYTIKTSYGKLTIKNKIDLNEQSALKISILLLKATAENSDMLCQCENLNVFNEKNGTIAHWANDGILPTFPRNKARNAYLEKHGSPRLHLQSTTRLITQV